MTEKNSNRLSLVIAILAILLILGGVFLLNESFNPSTSKTSAKSPLKEQVKVSKTNKDNETKTNSDNASIAGTFQTENDDEDTSSTSPKNTADTATTTKVAPKEEPAPAQPPATKTEEPPAPAPQQTTPAPAPKEEPKPAPVAPAQTTNRPVTLRKDQFTAKITGVSGNRYTINLTGCGLANALYCKPGTVLTLYSLNNFAKDTVEGGNEYVFTGNFSEDNKGLFIGTLSSMDRI